MRSHTEVKKGVSSRSYTAPVPNALAHQAQLRSVLFRAGVQPRLKIGAVDEPLERVMRMPEPLVSSGAQQQGAVQGERIQRKEASPESQDSQSTSHAVDNAVDKLEIEPWLGNIPIETHAHVVIFTRLAIISLRSELGKVESGALKEQAGAWIYWAEGALPYFDKRADEKVENPDIVRLINHQHDELLKIQKAVHYDRLGQIRDALRSEREAALVAAKRAEELQLRMDDALRSAFRQSSNNTLREVVSTIESVVSTGLELYTLASEIWRDIGKLPMVKDPQHWMYKLIDPQAAVGKYTQMLGNVGRGLSALNVAFTLLDSSKMATEAEQGAKEIVDAFTIFDLCSVAGIPVLPHFALYTNSCLKPALKVVCKKISALVETLSKKNREFVYMTGELIHPDAEPGGKEMFELMRKVMHAKDVSGVPELPSGVKEYLFNHREKLSAGASSVGAELPLEGIFGFRKYSEGPEGRSWLFNNRGRVWAMFYGAMKVPAASH